MKKVLGFALLMGLTAGVVAWALNTQPTPDVASLDGELPPSELLEQENVPRPPDFAEAIPATENESEPVPDPAPEEAPFTEEILENTGAASVTTSPPLAAVTEAIKPRFPTEGIFAPINERVRDSVVNIFCTRKSGRTVKTSSGSGVIIDPRGVILTNAHVAELFLLEGSTAGGSTSCTVRAGNPAREAYDARLLYISENWLTKFAPKLSAKDPRGTGESDFALLSITHAENRSSFMPPTFSFVPRAEGINRVGGGEHVLVAGYPALSENIRALTKRLYLVSTLATVGTLFTFHGSTLDIFAVEKTLAAQEGVSGGAVVNDHGELLGIVVTRTKASSTLERELRVLSLEHIERQMVAETGKDIASYLAGDLKRVRQEFDETRGDALSALVLKQFEK